jgi:hypothetical protein
MKIDVVVVSIAAGTLLIAGTALAGGKRDGSTCHTHRSCQSKVCARLEPEDKFGVCCRPLDCPEIGAQCGTTTDGCGTPLECGTCSPGEQCVSNQCVASTTTSTTTTSTTTSSTTSSSTSTTSTTTTSTTLGGTTTTIPSSTTTSTPVTTSTLGICLVAGETFDLAGAFTLEQCVDALVAAAETRCCTGELDPADGFEFSSVLPRCRGFCSSPTTTTSGSGCLGFDEPFNLVGTFTIDECVDALFTAAETECCVGTLNPQHGFEFGTDPQICRGFCGQDAP